MPGGLSLPEACAAGLGRPFEPTVCVSVLDVHRPWTVRRQAPRFVAVESPRDEAVLAQKEVS